MVALDGRLYAISGEAGRNVPATEMYVPEEDRWYLARPIPTPRDHLSTAVWDGQIYVIGGRASNMSMTLTTNEAYDPTMDSWRSLAPMPTGRSGIGAAALNGRVYVFGGENPFKTYNENESYDIATDSWQSHPPMPTARHGLTAAAFGDSIYVIAGGRTPGAAESDLNEVFQPFQG